MCHVCGFIYAICVCNLNWKLIQDHFLIKHWIQHTHRCSAPVVGLEEYSTHGWRAETSYNALQILGESGACGIPHPTGIPHLEFFSGIRLRNSQKAQFQIAATRVPMWISFFFFKWRTMFTMFLLSWKPNKNASIWKFFTTNIFH